MHTNTLMIRCVLGIVTLVGLRSVTAADEAPIEVHKHEPWGYHDADWTSDVSGWKPLSLGEHPRLVFRKADLQML